MHNAFCAGIICRKTDRKDKCFKCRTWLCGKCSKARNKKIYCPDCWLEIELKEQWTELKEEFKTGFI